MKLGINRGMTIGGGNRARFGPERLTNGDFSAGTTGWAVSGADGTHIATFSGGTLRYQSDTTTPQLVVQQLGAMVIGRTYRVEVETSAYTSGSIKTDSLGTNILSNAAGTIVFSAVATSTTFQITRNSTNVDITITRVSIREVL